MKAVPLLSYFCGGGHSPWSEAPGRIPQRCCERSQHRCGEKIIHVCWMAFIGHSLWSRHDCQTLGWVNSEWDSPYPQGTWSHDSSLWENKPTAWMSIKKKKEYFEPWKEGNSIDNWKESEMTSWRKVQFHLRLCGMVGTVLVTAEDCLLPLILLGRAISSSQEKVAMASAGSVERDVTEMLSQMPQLWFRYGKPGRDNSPPTHTLSPTCWGGTGGVRSKPIYLCWVTLMPAF